MSAPPASCAGPRCTTATRRPARGWSPFAGWEMPVQYADGIRAEHEAVRSAAGVFDVSHMGEIETSGPQAAEFLQHLLSNDVRRMPEGGAQYSVMCLDDGGIVDDLFTYRLAEQHFLTVTNAANHAKDLAYFQRQAEGFDVDVTDRADDFAMLAVQGPAARGIVERLADGRLPARFHCCSRTVAGVAAARLRHRLHGRGRRRAAARPRRRRRRSGTRWSRPASTPVGLGARDTLRLEVNYHLYGNDMDETRNPIEAGLGWACKEATGFVGAEAVARRPRERHRREARRVRDDRARHRPPGQPDRRRRDRHQRHDVAEPRRRHRHGLRARRRAPSPARPSRSTCAARRARAEVRPKPLYRRSTEWLTTRPTSSTTPEHDWARVDGDSATLGITWYAQDSLGEIVFFDPPQVGADDHQGRALRRGRVRQGRLRRDRAAVRRDHRGQRGARPDARRRSTRTPTATAGSSRSSSPTRPRLDDLMDAAAYEATLDG